MSQEIETRVNNQPAFGDNAAVLREAKRMRAEFIVNGFRCLLRLPLRQAHGRVRLNRPATA